MSPIYGIKYKVKLLKKLRSQFGLFKTFKHLAFRLVNRLCYFDCLHIIVLSREDVKPLDADKNQRLSTRMATRKDLEEMQEQGCWHLNRKKMEYFDQGDTCLLSYVDNNLAGYTWAHSNGRPELVEGLRVSVPDEYLYNFAGFTLPEYRGHGLQSFRHRELLTRHRWRNKKGLLGYVVHTNHSSRRGQSKSGYKKIGNIYLIGSKTHFYVHIGKSLRSMGIKRIDADVVNRNDTEMNLNRSMITAAAVKREFREIKS